MKKIVFMPVLFALAISSVASANMFGLSLKTDLRSHLEEDGHSEHINLAVATSGSVSPTPQASIAPNTCMANAVDKRDTAIITAWDGFAAAIHGALVARKDALKAAWLMTNRTERRQAIKTAWQNYHDAVKTAHKNLKNARRAAWNQFDVDRKACGTSTQDKIDSGHDRQSDNI